MSKDWDLNNDEHLKELAHALLMSSHGHWGSNDPDKQPSEFRTKIYDYQQQIIKGLQKKYRDDNKDDVDEIKMPFLIGDRVKSKTSIYTTKPIFQRGCVYAFTKDGKRMILTNGNVVKIDDYELDDEETPVNMHEKTIPQRYVECTEDTSYERCKRLEKALQTTVAWFLTKMSDREHFKQWEREKTSISGIPCIYPKDS